MFSGVKWKSLEAISHIIQIITYLPGLPNAKKGEKIYGLGTNPQSGNVSFGVILPLVQVNHQTLENHDCQERPTMDQNAVLRCCLSLGHVPSKKFYFWYYQVFRALIKLTQQKVNTKKIILLEKLLKRLTNMSSEPNLLKEIL